jgi:thioredoxin reductase (NADPH)
VRSSQFKASRIIQEKVLAHPKISVRWHIEVKEFIGENSKLTRLKVLDNQTGETEELSMDGAFIFIGLEPNSGFLANSRVLLNHWGFITTGHDLTHSGELPTGYERREPHLMETSIPGIFAAGDVRDKSTKQVASAAGEGASAALMIREYLKSV